MAIWGKILGSSASFIFLAALWDDEDPLTAIKETAFVGIIVGVLGLLGFSGDLDGAGFRVFLRW